MKDEQIIKMAAVGFLVLVVAPMVIGGAINVVGATATGIGNMVNKVKFNSKIKKGLKDGSIVEIDGKYYEVEKVENVEEA